MARPVKCYITGEQGTNETFIKIGKHYYKSQEIYDNDKKERELRKELRDKILKIIIEDFLEFAPGQPFPTQVTKKLSELKFYSDDVILKTIEKNYDNIKFFMKNKEFKNDYGRICYIFAIIGNNISDVYKAEMRTQRRLENKKSKDVEDLFPATNSNSKLKNNTNDISSFL